MVGWRRWVHLALILAASRARLLPGARLPRPRQRGTPDPRSGRRSSSWPCWRLGVVRQLRLHLDHTDRRVDGLIVSITVVMAVFSFVLLHPRSSATRASSPSWRPGWTRSTSRWPPRRASATATCTRRDRRRARLVLVLMVFNVVFVGTAVALMSSRIRARGQRAARHGTDASPNERSRPLRRCAQRCRRATGAR